MSLILSMERIRDEDRPKVGGKAFALASLPKGEFTVPQAICITTDAYDAYVSLTGLRERILMEIHRKDFREMRWEEMWDASLRIRNMFLNTPIPSQLLAALGDAVTPFSAGKAVAVRSSAPGEDSAKASFAGLHESYVNVRGGDVILDHVRKVWASLWSDSALLYRRELGLDPDKSAMAVLIQEMVLGERSGVVFCRSPMDPSQAVIESVHGLNQGLVDGTVEPDRWIVKRASREILSHVEPVRDCWVAPVEGGAALEALPPELASRPPLSDDEAKAVCRLAMSAEDHFGAPQDVEWTFRKGVLHLLQSRPITTGESDNRTDNRAWYLSLRRSFDNLRALRNTIEDDLIPAILRDGADLESMDLEALPLEELASEAERRGDIHRRWVETYWRDFIPFAHGARLFGQVYNDAVRPADPYEFMGLLAATEMESLKRNRLLEGMARELRESPRLRNAIERGDAAREDPSFGGRLDAFVSRYGLLICPGGPSADCRFHVSGILLKMAEAPPTSSGAVPASVSAEAFLSRFEGKQREEAAEMLDLARASYRLRDDDNLHLARIEAELDRAVALAEARLAPDSVTPEDLGACRERISRVKKKGYVPRSTAASPTVNPDFEIRRRQLTGQPAGPGLARGPARVITKRSDLTQFQSGEVLVCDAVDPAMTFVVPLCAGIVERRGGMLIHGAIIAREYGLPCVTGVTEATTRIRTGQALTVDGYLGIVIVGPDSIG